MFYIFYVAQYIFYVIDQYYQRHLEIPSYILHLHINPYQYTKSRASSGVSFTYRQYLTLRYVNSILKSIYQHFLRRAWIQCTCSQTLKLFDFCVATWQNILFHNLAATLHLALTPPTLLYRFTDI